MGCWKGAENKTKRNEQAFETWNEEDASEMWNEINVNRKGAEHASQSKTGDALGERKAF